MLDTTKLVGWLNEIGQDIVERTNVDFSERGEQIWRSGAERP